MDELKALFEQVIDEKLSEIKRQASTYGEAKDLAYRLSWSSKRPASPAERLEELIGKEVLRRLNEEMKLVSF